MMIDTAPHPTHPTSTDPADTMSYDDALTTFLATKGSFDGGLSNHGPMASEALVHMGRARWIGPFVEAYTPRLVPRPPAEIEPVDWRVLLRAELPPLLGSAASHAGHGLLRVAHAVRGIERGEADGYVPEVRVAELAAALGYWRSGAPSLPSPPALTGRSSLEEWAESLAALATFEPLDAMLTQTLVISARQEGFIETIASLRPAGDDGDDADTLDQLALLAVGGYLRNEAFLSWFAMLHGVTVSTMARVLLPHLDPADRRQLVASVAGFVGAAVIGFDRPPADVRPAPTPAGDQADRAVATLDDHSIKFGDAALHLAERTGSDLPLFALERQIERTS